MIGDVPDLTSWLKQITEAHLCSHVGHSLKAKDYEIRLVWLTTADAIQYITQREV